MAMTMRIARGPLGPVRERAAQAVAVAVAGAAVRRRAGWNVEARRRGPVDGGPVVAHDRAAPAAAVIEGRRWRLVADVAAPRISSRAACR
jgi:hypothetical protein